VAAVLAVEPVLRAERLTGLLGAVAGVGFVGFVWGLARGRTWAVPWAVVVLGGAYAASLFLPERDVDRSAPLLAAALVLLGELAYWTLELRAPISPEPGMLERRSALIAVTTIGSFILASVALAATAVPLGGGVLGDLLGVVAAIAAFALVAWLAQRERSQQLG
jgi:hypothetical protein